MRKRTVYDPYNRDEKILRRPRPVTVAMDAIVEEVPHTGRESFEVSLLLAEAYPEAFRLLRKADERIEILEGLAGNVRFCLGQIKLAMDAIAAGHKGWAERMRGWRRELDRTVRLLGRTVRAGIRPPHEARVWYVGLHALATIQQCELALRWARELPEEHRIPALLGAIDGSQRAGALHPWTLPIAAAPCLHEYLARSPRDGAQEWAASAYGFAGGSGLRKILPDCAKKPRTPPRKQPRRGKRRPPK